MQMNTSKQNLNHKAIGKNWEFREFVERYSYHGFYNFVF